MARKRKLPARRENTQPVVREFAWHRQDEGRLGEIGPSRHRLHLISAHSLRVENDRDRVPPERPVAEDVDDPKGPHGFPLTLK